jgi:hypothetical protein
LHEITFKKFAKTSKSISSKITNLL